MDLKHFLVLKVQVIMRKKGIGQLDKRGNEILYHFTTLYPWEKTV